MEKLPYKILTISWDPTLAMDKPTFGDVQERNVKYGERVEKIYAITYTSKKNGLTNKQLSKNVIAYPTNSAHQVRFIFDAFKIASRLCQKEKIDLVLTQDPFLTGLVGWWLKKKFGVKFLIHVHGDFFANRNWLKEAWYNPILMNFLAKWLIKKADAVRVMSAGQKDKLVNMGLAENKIRIISTPVNLDKYQENNKSIKQENHKLKIVLHIGRDDEVKDYDTLIKVFKIIKSKMPNVKFIQAGANEKIKEAMKGNKFTDVELMGLRPQEELIGLYQNCDIFVLSSTSESFGKVLVEANACGRPVVSTTTTGAKEIIEDGRNGFLVPIKDYRAFAEKIIYLLQNPQIAAEMGECGRKLMQEKFGDNTEKIVKFWQEIIEEKL